MASRLMLLDSDVVIDVLRGHQPAAAWFATVTAKPMISGFAAMEVQTGCRDAAEMRNVTRLLARMDIIWPPVSVLDAAYSSFGAYHLRYGMSSADALVAATATWLSMPLATFNVRHFRNVPGLQTVQPYTR